MSECNKSVGEWVSAAVQNDKVVCRRVAKSWKMDASEKNIVKDVAFWRWAPVMAPELPLSETKKRKKASNAEKCDKSSSKPKHRAKSIEYMGKDRALITTLE